MTDEQIRDGLIQRFEFTDELSHRMLRRYLASVSPSPDEFDTMPFQDMIRIGNQHGLLQGRLAGMAHAPGDAQSDDPLVRRAGGRRGGSRHPGVPG